MRKPCGVWALAAIVAVGVGCGSDSEGLRRSSQLDAGGSGGKPTRSSSKPGASTSNAGAGGGVSQLSSQGGTDETLPGGSGGVTQQAASTSSATPIAAGGTFESSTSGSAAAQGGAAGTLSGGSSGTSVSEPEAQALRIEVQPTTWVNEVSLDAAGGTIAPAPDSPLGQVTIDIPEGTLPEPTTMRVGYRPASVTDRSEVRALQVLSLELDPPTELNGPVTISVPIDLTENEIAVPFYLDEQQQLLPVSVLELNREAKILRFETSHNSDYAIVTLSLGVWNVDTGFRPSVDGFAIDNFGSVYSPKGNCAGMTAFATWYATLPGSRTPLARRFREMLDGDPSVTASHAIAGRAQLMTLHGSSVTAATEVDMFQSVAAQLYVTHRPSLLTIDRKLPRTDLPLHAVVAYAVNGNEISIYDPSIRENDSLRLRFNASTNQFEAYVPTGNASSGTARWFPRKLWGLGSESLAPLSRLLKDAEVGFHGFSHTTFLGMALKPNQLVTVPELLLEGQVQRGMADVTRAIFRNMNSADGDTPKTVELTESGEFSTRLPLLEGANTIRILAAFTGTGATRSALISSIDGEFCVLDEVCHAAEVDVPVVYCPTGKTWNATSSRCECPVTGQRWTGTECQCPEGQEIVAGACVPRKCDSGELGSNGIPVWAEQGSCEAYSNGEGGIAGCSCCPIYRQSPPWDLEGCGSWVFGRHPNGGVSTWCLPVPEGFYFRNPNGGGCVVE